MLIRNTGLFNIWLKEVLTPQLTPGSVLILNNASFHKSAESRKIVESAGCKLMFLPPYSPDLNPIEKYWANMKNKVREILRGCITSKSVRRFFLIPYGTVSI